MNRLPILYSFIGTIIGASFFALPFIISHQNLYISIFIFFLVFLIVSYTNYIYTEIITKTQSTHQLPGYAEIYLGKNSKVLITIMSFLGGIGGNLAYIIISISFIKILLPNINSNMLAIIIILFIGISTSNGAIFKRSEKILTITLAGLLLFLSFYLIFSSDFNYTINLLINNKINYYYIFPMLGITLSANAGAGILPELKKELKNTNRLLTIFSNALIPLLLYVLFISGVLGNNEIVSKDSLTGLTNILPQALVYITVIVGLLAILTSFESNIVVNIDTLRQDFNFRKITATTIVILIPTILFITGLTDLLLVLSIVGGVFTAFTHLIIHLIGDKILKINIWSKISMLILCLMILGEMINVLLRFFDIFN